MRYEQVTQVLAVGVIILAIIAIIYWYKLHSFKKQSAALFEAQEQEKQSIQTRLSEELDQSKLQSNRDLTDKESELQIAKNQFEQDNERREKELKDIRDKANEDSLIFAEAILDYTRQKDASDYLPLPILLDDLESEFGYSNPGKTWKKAQKQSQIIASSGNAVTCDNPNHRFCERSKAFVLEVFNSAISSLFEKITHENCSEFLGDLRKAYTEINANSKALLGARITKDYYNSKIVELKAKSAVLSLKKISRDEQRALAEQKRDEEKAKREIEKAQREAAREQEALHKALEQARVQMETASAEERTKFEEQMEEMRNKLAIAEAKGERAKSMAELTKRGHVYIISNVGSFGEDVVKIGMTRRLNPEDRIYELGSASVPFTFDIHAMIEADDAPKLEFELHQEFNNMRINRINPRKEFFKVSIADIKSFLESKSLLGKSHFTMKAEAKEYRDSLVIASMPEAKQHEQMERLAEAEKENVDDDEDAES